MIKIRLPKFKFFKKIQKYLLPGILSFILFFLIVFTYEEFVSEKYYPRTFVGDTEVTFLNEGQAIQRVQNTFDKRRAEKLNFHVSGGTFTVDLATSSASLDYSALSYEFEQRKRYNFWQYLQKQLQAITISTQIDPSISLSAEKQLAVIQSAIEKQPLNAQLLFDEITTPEGSPSSRIQIKEAVDGLTLDKEKLTSEAVQFLLTGQYDSALPTKINPPKVTTQQLLMAKGALEEVSKEPIILQFQDFKWTLDAKQLLTLLDQKNGSENLLDKDQTHLYLAEIAKEIDQEVQEGLFEFNPQTKRVAAFKPSLEGRKLDLDKTFESLVEAIKNKNTKVINLSVDIVKPKIQTSDVNNLGIKELLGSGISHFSGSIPNRIYNVSLTASKINGVLIPPGEIFSFNQTVGDISAATGFKQAYVIKEGRTVLDDGGGVCQDSTTLFRAVLNAGLPVVKRTAHAYRVGYYEQGFPPGLDATVYYPSVDFQFKNDTSHHILVQAYTAGTTLYIDLYGTPDGREVSLTTPRVTNQTPPPPELRQDDPTLPKGQIKQVDWAAWGATVTFKRTITRGGETISSENWVSNYRPWQAVYLVGTQ